MPNGFDHDRYQQYLAIAAHDLGLVQFHSLQEGRNGWGLRHLSPSELENLSNVAAHDVELQERWRERMTAGYHREKSRVADEVEEFFTQIPTDDDASKTCDQAA
jgi:hypothetical protein